METYHKIQTVYKRDPATNYKTLLIDNFSLPEFDYLRNNEWVFTEKVDGTNIRVMYSLGKIITFGGKTDLAQIPELCSRSCHWQGALPSCGDSAGSSSSARSALDRAELCA